MADPLQLLRDFTIKGKKVEENDTQLIFGDLAADKKVHCHRPSLQGRCLSDRHDCQSLTAFFSSSGSVLYVTLWTMGAIPAASL